ncbi:MAG: ribosomal protein S18-alanine N-acetyltransferase [Erysipelotrichaceae bacterium]|nr:ribosomal protein S18-alanine N-acetyltransferase [Erysipelotrichaceae bacterium]
MLRLMKETDLPIVLELEEQLFTSTWKMDDFLYEMNENPFSQMFVWEEDSEIVGYMGIWIIFEQAQLTNLAVNKKYQGKGYGRKLLEMGISLCQEASCEIMTLEVRQSNVVAKSLYQSCGFEKVSVKKDYYQDNHEDADVMMKGLI